MAALVGWFALERAKVRRQTEPTRTLARSLAALWGQTVGDGDVLEFSATCRGRPFTVRVPVYSRTVSLVVPARPSLPPCTLTTERVGGRSLADYAHCWLLYVGPEGVEELVSPDGPHNRSLPEVPSELASSLRETGMPWLQVDAHQLVWTGPAPDIAASFRGTAERCMTLALALETASRRPNSI